MAPEELEQQRLAFAVEQGVIAARVGIPASAIVAAASLPATGVRGSLAWGAAMLVILLVRNRMLRRAGRLLARPNGAALAQRAMHSSTLLLAFGLGILPAVAFPGLDYQLRLFVTVFFCCWYSAGMASLGVSPNMYTAYLVIVLGGWYFVPNAPAVAAPAVASVSNTAALGELLYTRYVYLLEVAGFVLLVAMIGAIVLTLHHRTGVKRQSIAQQNARTPATAIEVRKVESGRGL